MLLLLLLLAEDTDELGENIVARLRRADSSMRPGKLGHCDVESSTGTELCSKVRQYDIYMNTEVINIAVQFVNFRCKVRLVIVLYLHGY